MTLSPDLPTNFQQDHLSSKFTSTKGATMTNGPHQLARRVARLAQQAEVISIIDRAIDKLPAELIHKILEAIMASNKPSWRPSYSKDRSAASRPEPSSKQGMEACFQWPPGLDQATRDLLDQIAAPVFLKNIILELPAHYRSQGSTMTLSLPKAIRGHGQHIRQLVLDVQIGQSHAAHQPGLHRTITHMDDLRTLLPQLTSCVICIYFRRTGRFFDPPRSFLVQSLNRINRTGCSQTETLRTSLVRLVRVFHEKGPGVRKFIRFSIQAARDHSRSAYGPLLEIATTTAASDDEQSVGLSTAHVGSNLDIVEQVVQRAHRFLRAQKRAGS